MGERMRDIETRAPIVLAVCLLVLSAAGCSAKLDSPPRTPGPAVEASSTPYRFALAGKREFQSDAVVQSPDATSVAIRIPATVAGIPVFESLRVTNPHNLRLRNAEPGLNMSVVLEYRDGGLQLKSAGLPRNGPLLSSWPFFTYSAPSPSGFPHRLPKEVPVDGWPSNYATASPASPGASPWFALSSAGTGTVEGLTAGGSSMEGDAPNFTWWSLEVQVPDSFDGQPMRHLLTVWGNPSSKIVDSAGNAMSFDRITADSAVLLKVDVQKLGPTLFAREVVVGKGVDAGNW
jgi:hypothetical protein